MKKLLTLISFCLCFGLTAGQYVYFSGVNGNTYPQQCTGSLAVYANTQNKAEGAVRLGILYGNDLIYATGSSNAIKGSTFKPNFTTTSFMNKFAGAQDQSLMIYNPVVFSFSQCSGTNRCLFVDMKRDDEVNMPGELLLGTMEFKPEMKNVDSYSTVFEFIFNPNAENGNWSDGTVINNNKPNLTIQNQKRVYTGTVVQTPCKADTNAPKVSITDYDGLNINNSIKIGINRGLMIEMTDNDANGETPLVFDADNSDKWGTNPGGINDQYGIDLESSRSVISITKGNQPLLTAVPLSDLSRYGWTVEWSGKTWRGSRDKGLNAIIKVDGEHLAATPVGDLGAQWLGQHQVGMSAYEGETIGDWGVEKEIIITLKVFDRAGYSTDASIIFNRAGDPTLSNVSPANNAEMVNLTDPVSGKISDTWAGVSGNTIVVVLSGINDEASGYRHVFSGNQLNLSGVAGLDYTYSIVNHEDFPEKGQIKVIVYAKDNEGNGKAYSNGAAGTGIGSYTFTARPSCSEFQCCDDNIHIKYANVNIQNGTSVLYTGSTLTIVGGSGSLSGNDFFRIDGSTGILNCGVSVAGLTFHSRKITSTRAGENGFTDTGTIVGSGNGTFIVQSGDDLILGYMKDYVGLYDVQPDSTHYVTNVDNFNFSWKLLGSSDFVTLLGVQAPDSIELGTEWFNKYVLSVEIPARITSGNYAIEYVAEFKDLEDPYSFDLSTIGNASNLVYTTHLCPTGLSWDYGTDSCTPVLDPVCGENEKIANGKCVCAAGYAHNREGICKPISELNADCRSINGNEKPRWSENTRDCIPNEDYCALYGLSDRNGSTCEGLSEPLTIEGGYIHCTESNQVYVDGSCVVLRDPCGDKFYNGSTCVDLSTTAEMDTYCEEHAGGSVDTNNYECVCASGKYLLEGAGCVTDGTTINTDRGDLNNFDLKGYFEGDYEGTMLDGTYTGKVRVVDIEGRVSDPLLFTFMVDTTPPLCYISATQSYMCTGDSAMTLTMTGDSNSGYSFRWSLNEDWVAGTQSTYSITGWGDFTGYVQDAAGNTGSCTITITNPEVQISDYTLAGVYTGTITVTGLIEKMNILEGTGDEDCGTGHITLSVSDCVEGVVTGVISNTDTLTITLSGGVEHLTTGTTYCTVVATDSENTARNAKIYFAFDTLAPACTMAIDNTECEDIVSLETLAKCKDGEEYNSNLGLCVPSCNGTLHEKGNKEYLCCPAGTLFDGSVCKDRGEFDCSDSELIVSANGVTQCKSAAVMSHDSNMVCSQPTEVPNEIGNEHPVAASGDSCSCKPGSSWYYEGGQFTCVLDSEIGHCPEGSTWNGSYCDMCGDGKMYITSTILATMNDEYSDKFDMSNFVEAGCYEESLFIDCHRSEEPICYGSNLPIVVTVLGDRSPIVTYVWDKPSGVQFRGTSVDGNVPSLVVSEVGAYKLTVMDEYGNEGTCTPDIEITGSRLDMIAPIVTGNDISGYECQTITGSVSVTDEGCAGDWTYRWYDTTGLISGVTTGEYGLYQTVTGTQTRDVVVVDILGNQAITGTVSYTWNDLPLYINSGSYDLGILLPEEGGVPSTGLDAIDLFEAQEMSGDVTCGVGTGITLDSFACDLEFVTGAIDSVTGSIANIIVGEYASATGVSCTGTISDDDGNTTGFELTFDVGREGLIIGTPESVSVTAESTDIVIKMPGFRVEDKRGWDTGYYTTIQSKGLFNISNGTNVAVRIESDHGSSGLLMLTDGTLNGTTVNSALWDDNGGVTFDNTSDPVLYFYRANNSDNGGVKNRYEDELDLFVQNVAAGTYTGEIVFTLYDRSFIMDHADDGVYWNSGQNLISIVKNGVTQYTLQDKNLGASVAGTGEESYGNYYQWGNNYGFPNTGLVSLAYANLPVNSLPFSIDRFVSVEFSYSFGQNVSHGMWGVSESDPLRQGPCDEGYRIPSVAEWTGLELALDGTSPLQKVQNLKIPMAGERWNHTGDNLGYSAGRGYDTFLWAADLVNVGDPEAIYIRQNSSFHLYEEPDTNYASHGFSMRCFKNSVVSPTGEGWVKTLSL